MGTNFYLASEKCACCGRSDEPLHIGKSSIGWVFALRVYPERGINSLGDWVPLFRSGSIVDEYGREVSADHMIAGIAHRKPGLRRETPDGRHCVGNGVGTFDLFVGEFS